MKKYDLHCHTKYSNCSLNKPETILKIAKKIGLNGIAITDHNEIKGALKVKKLNKNKDFEVIIGEEIKTKQGEILAFYINEKIIANEIEEAIEKIKEQGALMSIAHPFDIHLLRKTLDINLKKINYKGAIETFNSRCLFNKHNKKAKNLALNLKLPETGGSDAHFPWEIGKGYTLFKGNFEKSIKLRKTKTYGTNNFSIVNRTLSMLPKILSKF